MAWPEPSNNDHDAPWNEGPDGECACTRCRKKAREEAEAEREIDEK
jgi:hypothetical protein